MREQKPRRKASRANSCILCWAAAQGPPEERQRSSQAGLCGTCSAQNLQKITGREGGRRPTGRASRADSQSASRPRASGCKDAHPVHGPTEGGPPNSNHPPQATETAAGARERPHTARGRRAHPQPGEGSGKARACSGGGAAAARGARRSPSTHVNNSTTIGLPLTSLYLNATRMPTLKCQAVRRRVCGM